LVKVNSLPSKKYRIMIRIIDNHLIIYHNDTDPSRWFMMGSDSNSYGSWTFSPFTNGKFKAYQTKYYVPAGGVFTVNSTFGNSFPVTISSNSVIIKNICP